MNAPHLGGGSAPSAAGARSPQVMTPEPASARSSSDLARRGRHRASAPCQPHRCAWRRDDWHPSPGHGPTPATRPLELTPDGRQPRKGPNRLLRRQPSRRHDPATSSSYVLAATGGCGRSNLTRRRSVASWQPTKKPKPALDRSRPFRDDLPYHRATEQQPAGSICGTRRRRHCRGCSMLTPPAAVGRQGLVPRHARAGVLRGGTAWSAGTVRRWAFVTTRHGSEPEGLRRQRRTWVTRKRIWSLRHGRMTCRQSAGVPVGVSAPDVGRSGTSV
jgi:hypothetical protein